MNSNDFVIGIGVLLLDFQYREIILNVCAKCKEKEV
jgi:hypothetical protein